MAKRKRVVNKNNKRTVVKPDETFTDTPIFVPLLIKKSQLYIAERDEKNRISKVSLNMKETVGLHVNLEAIISELREAHKETQIHLQKINSLEMNRDDLNEKVRILQTENKEIKSQVVQLEQDNKNLQKQLDQLGQDNENLKKQLGTILSGKEKIKSQSGQKEAENRTYGQTAKKQTGKTKDAASEKTGQHRTKLEIIAGLLEEMKTPDDQGQMPLITFGSYKQGSDKTREPIKWKVLWKKEKTIFLLSDRILDVKPYHNSSASVTWETCDLRTWLNVDFVKEAFHGEEQFLLKFTEIRNDNNKSYSTRGGKNTKDRVFLLSQDEYDQFFPDKDFAKASATKKAKDKKLSCRPGTDFGNWWLRSPGNGVVKAALIDPSGSQVPEGRTVIDSKIGVRPALWLDLG